MNFQVKSHQNNLQKKDSKVSHGNHCTVRYKTLTAEHDMCDGFQQQNFFVVALIGNLSGSMLVQRTNSKAVILMS